MPNPPITLLETAPQPGQLVHVRQRRYLVEEVNPPPVAGQATIVSLSCVDDDAQGQPLQEPDGGVRAHFEPP